MNLTFFTPTYAQDVGRFTLLRESMQRFGIDLPHVAVVNHEDIPLFKAMPYQRHLTVLSTRDVLSPQMDRRRRLWLAGRRNPEVWFTPRRFSGWIAQQIIKLAAPKVLPAEGIICLDSDLFFIGNVTAGDFLSADGRLHFYESEIGVDVELAEWYGRAMRFLGHSPAKIKPRRFMYNAVPFHREILLDLHRAIEKQHGMSWMEAIARSQWVTEYALYGAFCNLGSYADRLAPVEPSLCADCWYTDEVEAMWQTIQVGAASGKKIAHLQSNLKIPVEKFRGRVEEIWKRCGGGA
jgi:hypothetical protein